MATNYTKLIFDDKLEMPPERIFERVRSYAMGYTVEHYLPGREGRRGHIYINTKGGDPLGEIHYALHFTKTSTRVTFDDWENAEDKEKAAEWAARSDYQRNPEKEKLLREIVWYILIEAWDRTRADKWLATGNALGAGGNTPPRLTGGARKIVLQRAKPGTKAEPLYDAAYKTVAEGNFTQEAYDEAFDNYCRQANLTKPDRKVRNAFKVAIKRRIDGLATQ